MEGEKVGEVKKAKEIFLHCPHFVSHYPAFYSHEILFISLFMFSIISLTEKMKNKKATATEEENEVNGWDIYKEVIGGPSHGRILGLGGGFSTKDVYHSDSVWR
ncbi:hypothetical protein PRUPE_7G020400 [Prunus persica]|uniref:Uncharacterized protein n=1 Tax=Prunus persica TaxID=3760 RepID=M5VRS4_PRUPE|nr:hypothetical protein PRUPE_7G020400 [Prunus persica]